MIRLRDIVATFILMPLMNISIKTGVAIVGLPFLLISIIKLILDIKKFILQKGNKQRERLILYIIIDMFYIFRGCTIILYRWS